MTQTARKRHCRRTGGSRSEIAFDVQREPGPNIETRCVQVVIYEVFPGIKYDDTCLAEIAVWDTVK